MDKSMQFIRAVFRLSVSLLSYCFVFAARKILIKKRIASEKKMTGIVYSPKWRGWSAQQKAPFALLKSMIVHPRWNPHPIQHIAGPCPVEGAIGINGDMMADSAEYWIISIYRDWSEVKTISSDMPDGHPKWIRTELERGNYTFFIRYFNPHKNGKCPEINIDGVSMIEALPIENEEKAYHQFLSGIKNKKGAFYHFVHYYVCSLLYWREHVSASFVKKHFLPYGNPGTEFKYGLIGKNTPLVIHFDRNILSCSLVYIVFFNRCGFPVNWGDITEEHYISEPIAEECTYLIRIINKIHMDEKAPGACTLGEQPS